MGSNIVHQYFKKETAGMKIMVKIDPIRLTGVELTVESGKVLRRELEFDEAIFEDLKSNGFKEAGPLEFNLYHAGIA